MSQWLPGMNGLIRRVRSRWERIRPLPMPSYVPGAPALGVRGASNSRLPLNPLTLGAAAMSEEATNSVTAVLDKLAPSREITMVESFYRDAQASFGAHWRYADILTTLWAASMLIKPAAYLEIGMLSGRSAAVVGNTHPDCDIYGFDLWITDYFGDNSQKGPDSIRSELRAVGHTGKVEFISGDSRTTVPAFLAEHPDLYFDLITIDGDHSPMGAARDLANTLPRLKVGGIVVLDDIRWTPALMRVWKKVVVRDPRYASWDFRDTGFGVAAAIRIADGALPTPVQVPQEDHLARAARHTNGRIPAPDFRETVSPEPLTASRPDVHTHSR